MLEPPCSCSRVRCHYDGRVSKRNAAGILKDLANLVSAWTFATELHHQLNTSLRAPFLAGTEFFLKPATRTAVARHDSSFRRHSAVTREQVPRFFPRLLGILCESLNLGLLCLWQFACTRQEFKLQSRQRASDRSFRKKFEVALTLDRNQRSCRPLLRRTRNDSGKGQLS